MTKKILILISLNVCDENLKYIICGILLYLK